MDIKSVAVTLDADDLRVMASALRLYDRTCITSTADQQRIKALVHLAERSEGESGKCYAEMIQAGPHDTSMNATAGDGGSSI